jgi:iron-sulfur cluster assembly accessory protein
MRPLLSSLLHRSLLPPPFSSLRALSSAPAASLNISATAASRLASLRARAEADNLPDASHLCLRVRVDGGGCSGFKYEFLVERPPGGGAAADDSVFPAGPSRVLVDAASLPFLNGATLEWEDTMMRSAFIIAQNPNAESSCGCKASFSLKPT